MCRQARAIEEAHGDSLRFTFGKCIWLMDGLGRLTLWLKVMKRVGEPVMAGRRRIQGPRALRVVGGVFLALAFAGFLACASLVWLEYRSPRSETADGVIVGF